MKYRADIDGLRAVAIIPVVLYHAGLGFHGGFVGVDIFFVLSGYLLSSIVIQEMNEKRFSFRAFYERRFRRLAPAFVVMQLVTFGVFSIIMLPEDFKALGWASLGAIFFYANFHYYNAIDYFSQSADLMPLLHTWSLAIEEQFYALLPVSILVVLLLFPRRWLPGLIGLALLASFVLCIYYTDAHRPYAFYMPHTRAWELLIGTLLAAIPHLRGSSKITNILGVASLLIIVWAVFAYDERDAFPGWLAVAPVAATTALIYCGAVAPNGLSSRLLSLSPLVFIGKISYSLYLWHWPVMVFVRYGDLAPEEPLTQWVCVLISVLLATLSWALIEQPVRQRRVLATQGGVYFGAAVSAAGLALVAAGIIHFQGFPQRVPADLRVFLDETKYATPDTGCFFRERTASAEPCLRGAEGVPATFFLIGDSHANALSPGLFAAAKSEGVAGLQYTAPGFFPSIGRRLVGSDRTDARIDRVLKMIADRPEINTVIFSAAWADYARGSNWKGQRWLYQDDLGAARDAAGNVPVFARSLARIIDALPRHQIILLDDVPAGLELDLRFFVRRSMLQSFDRTDAVLPQEDADDRRSAYAPTLRKIAADRDNVLFIPVFEDFCRGPEGSPLFAADMATPIYRDGDHLSNYGALSWSEPFRKRVLSRIGARFSAN